MRALSRKLSGVIKRWLEIQVLDERLEIPICKEQWKSAVNAIGRNYRVDGFADRDTLFTKESIIVGCPDRLVSAQHFEYCQIHQQRFCFFMFAVTSKSL